MVRDVLLREIPNVLRTDLYAIPALLGATILVVGHETGSRSALFPLLAAFACTATRLLGVHYGLRLPIAPSERRKRATAEHEGHRAVQGVRLADPIA